MYMKRMIKDLSDKVFKYYIYIKHYDVALDLVRSLRPGKSSNMTFNKEPRISKEYLV